MPKKASALQPARSVSVFVAHSDSTSASRALAALSAHWRRRGQQLALRPMLWPFRQLAAPRWSETALHDALRAECVILAMDRPESFDAQLEGWVEALRNRAGGATLSLVVAIRDADLWAMTVASQPKPAASDGAPAASEVIGSVAARRPVVAAA